MPTRRQARLNEQLKREISGILHREIADPRIGPVTVTGVRVTADLAFARVFVRTLSDPSALDQAVEGLEGATAFIRRALGSRLRLRHVPELRFEEDRTLEQARRIEEILDDVRPADGWENDGDESSS